MNHRRQIKNDYPNDNPAEKMSLLAMNRDMFAEMPDIEYNRAVRQVFGSKADKVCPPYKLSSIRICT